MAKLPLLQVSTEQQTLELANYVPVPLTSQLLANQIVLLALDQQNATVRKGFAFLGSQELALLYFRHITMVVVFLLENKLLSDGVSRQKAKPLPPLPLFQNGLSPQHQSDHFYGLFLSVNYLPRTVNRNITQFQQRLYDDHARFLEELVALGNYVYEIFDRLAESFIVVHIVTYIRFSLGGCMIFRHLG